jgi:hypothetical protein
MEDGGAHIYRGYGECGPNVRRAPAKEARCLRQKSVNKMAKGSKPKTRSTAKAARAGDRFAFVAACGELAAEFGVTGWNGGEARVHLR